eukprot:COSAG04_NODE_11_length_42922_cov_38.819700_29_plen_237_part_00
MLSVTEPFIIDSLEALYGQCLVALGEAVPAGPPPPPPVTPQEAAEQFATVEAAAARDPATPMVSVASQIDFAADIETVAESTPARSEFEDGFKHSLARSLGDGSTVRPEAVFVDEVSEAAAMQAAMFGGARPPLNPLEPPRPAVGVHFHIAVPDGLQATTVSLVETLKESDEPLEVVVDGTTLVADTASLVAPVWISLGGQCDFDSTVDGDNASEAGSEALYVLSKLLLLLPSSSS